MKEFKEPPVSTQARVQLLASNVQEQLSEYAWRRAFNLFECLMKDDDHGTKGASPPIISNIQHSTRAIVYYGNEFNGGYNHHNQINKFKGKYYFAWSNGKRNEEDAGQRVLISSSTDGKNWGEAQVVLDVEEGSRWAHNCVAMYTDEEHIYIVIMSEETEHDETVTGMRRIRPDDAYIDLYRSCDGVTFEKVFSYGEGIKWIFEAPRLTMQGELLCICCTKNDGPAALIWPKGELCTMPEVVKITEPDGAWFPYGESTWYQLDNGRIVVFWRDEGASCRVYYNTSDDGGRTFTTPVISDIPDSMSRIYAGRLSDGRYFLVNNSTPILLDRRSLTLLLSDDGVTFSKVHMINDSPTEMRCKGLLKANGHQYPCCVVDGDKLVVAYDANKEDIMCEVIDMSKI